MTALARYTDLAELRTRVRTRADMRVSNPGDSLFLSDAEIDFFIHGSWGELWDLIIENYGEDMFESNYTFSTVSGQAFYGLDGLHTGGSQETAPPIVADIYKIIDVSVNISGSESYSIRHAQRKHVRQAQVQSGWSNAQNVRYKLQVAVGQRWMRKFLTFFPTPAGVHSVSVTYIPCAPELVEEPTTDTLLNLSATDGVGYTTPILYADWGEYVVVDAAAKCLETGESDSAFLLRRKASLEARIKWHAQTMRLDEAGSIRCFEDEHFNGREPW